MLASFLGSFKITRGIYVVLGQTGVGKSSLINQIAGYNVAEEGKGFESMTSEMKEIFIDHRGVKEFRNSIFIDTPGFSDTRGYAINTTGLLIEMMENINRTANFKFLLCNSAKDSRQYVQRIMNKLKIIFGTEIVKSTIIVLTFPRSGDNLSELWEHLEEETNHELQIVKYDSKIPYDNQDAKLWTALERLTPYNWAMLENAKIRLDLIIKELYENNSNWVLKNRTALESVSEKETCYRTKVVPGAYKKKIFKHDVCTSDRETTCYWKRTYDVCKQMGMINCRNWVKRVTHEEYSCYRPLTYDCSTTEEVNEHTNEIVKEAYDCHMPRVKEVVKYEKIYINSNIKYWRKEAKKQLILEIKSHSSSTNYETNYENKFNM